jgi:multiple sugar transport system permease protein
MAAGGAAIPLSGMDGDLGARQDGAGFAWSSSLLLALPVGFLFLLFVGPIFYALYLGFTNLELIGPNAQTWQFTGTANLTRLVHDPTFLSSVKLTVIFVVGSGIIGQTLVGLILALLFVRAVRTGEQAA